MSMPKILVIHGPNLDQLGKREPDIYGDNTLENINDSLVKQSGKLNVEVMTVQSNHEGVLIDCIHEKSGDIEGIIINPAALTHYSYALREALSASGLPVIEVHLSNIFARENFRQHSVISPVARGLICGLGINSYLLALEALIKIIEER